MSQQPGFHYYPVPIPVKPLGSGLATTAFALGVVTIVCGFVPVLGLVSFLTGPAGLAFCIAARNRGRYVATAAVMSGFGLAVAVMWAAILLTLNGTVTL